MTQEQDTICAWCGHHHDRTGAVVDKDGTPIDAPLPNDDDVTLCIKCGGWCLFDSTAAGGLRKPTPAELADIEAIPAAMSLRRAWATVAADLAARKGTIQ